MTNATHLSLRIPEKLNRMVEGKAERDQIPKSEVIRMALVQYLWKEDHPTAERKEAG